MADFSRKKYDFIDDVIALMKKKCDNINVNKMNLDSTVYFVKIGNSNVEAQICVAGYVDIFRAVDDYVNIPIKGTSEDMCDIILKYLLLFNNMISQEDFPVKYMQYKIKYVDGYKLFLTRKDAVSEYLRVRRNFLRGLFPYCPTIWEKDGIFYIDITDSIDDIYRG